MAPFGVDVVFHASASGVEIEFGSLRLRCAGGMIVPEADKVVPGLVVGWGGDGACRLFFDAMDWCREVAVSMRKRRHAVPSLDS